LTQTAPNILRFKVLPGLTPSGICFEKSAIQMKALFKRLFKKLFKRDKNGIDAAGDIPPPEINRAPKARLDQQTKSFQDDKGRGSSP
jgi:hypothetical protein